MSLFQEYLYNLVTGKIKGPLGIFLKGILFIFSLIYGSIVVMLAALYKIKQARFSAKVISVGNITLGGTGKTTFVEYLVNLLYLRGRKIAVLSRGYKRDPKKHGNQAIGDEPAMLKKRLPFARVIVDSDRVKAAYKAIKEYACDTLILDDGMQQWRIFKNLEIVTIDAFNPFGNCFMLPAGFLREPIRALRRADIFVLTQARPGQDTLGLYTKLRHLNPKALVVESMHQPVGFSNIFNPQDLLKPDVFKGKRVMIFSGIGNPDGFEDCIKELGAEIIKSFRFGDHHDYSYPDIDKIIEAAGKLNIDTIITTQKDAIKISQFRLEKVKIFALDIKLTITKNETELHRRLSKLYTL